MKSNIYHVISLQCWPCCRLRCC